MKSAASSLSAQDGTCRDRRKSPGTLWSWKGAPSKHWGNVSDIIGQNLVTAGQFSEDKAGDKCVKKGIISDLSWNASGYKISMPYLWDVGSQSRWRVGLRNEMKFSYFMFHIIIEMKYSNFISFTNYLNWNERRPWNSWISYIFSITFKCLFRPYLLNRMLIKDNKSKNSKRN